MPIWARDGLSMSSGHSFGVLGSWTLILMVTDKIKEIGTLTAMGARIEGAGTSEIRRMLIGRELMGLVD